MSMPRITWAQLPLAARSAVFEATGPVLAARNASDGVNSAIAARLRTQQGDVFVKGVPLDHPQIRTQQREADINPLLPGSCPRLLWRVCAGGWDLLGFELLDARRADYQPGSPDLPLVVDALTELSATRTPDVPLKRVEDRWAAYASTDELSLLAGDALLHTDIAPHNVLVNDRAHLIDWAWPTLGPAWVDPAVWVIRLIDAGHTPAPGPKRGLGTCLAGTGRRRRHSVPSLMPTPGCGARSSASQVRHGRRRWPLLRTHGPRIGTLPVARTVALPGDLVEITTQASTVEICRSTRLMERITIVSSAI